MTSILRIYVIFGIIIYSAKVEVNPLEIKEEILENQGHW